jgi:pimeloyl-ACP methyl ester carboxylesterase
MSHRSAGRAEGLGKPAPDIVRTDLFVPYASTVANGGGTLLPLHVVRKIARKPSGSVDKADRTVLFIHGTSVPAPVAFDLEYRDYSWIEYLAREGFDVWAMSMIGYGWSATPHMDNPCNVDPEMQPHLVGSVLDAACEPHFRCALTTNQSEWDQIDTVVDHILGVTGGAKLSLAVWSNGGPRGGGYAYHHPEKVNRLFMHAPGKSEAGTVVSREPDAGTPLTLQTRDQLFNGRWAANAPCEGQIDPAMFDIIWSELMRYDPIGALWTDEGVMRWPTRAPAGWSDDMVRGLTMPTLVLYGVYDDPLTRQGTFDLVGSDHKVRVEMACASHFIEWESGRHALHEASAEWLRDGTYRGVTDGQFRISASGEVLEHSA